MNTPLLYLFQEALETPEQRIERHYQEGRLSKTERDGKLRVCKVDRIIGEIRRNQGRPGSRLLTSAELRQRADLRRSMANQIKLTGGSVRPEYE